MKPAFKLCSKCQRIVATEATECPGCGNKGFQIIYNSRRISIERTLTITKRICGFDKIDPGRLKKESLDEDELIRILTTLQVNQNWIVRILWLIVAAMVGTNIAL